MNFADLLNKDFEIRDGKFYERNLGYTEFYVREAAWIKGEYNIFGDYSAGDYTIKTEQWSNAWYIYRGYSQVCRLEHRGGHNWKKY